jgi:small subunit ribosomal protein S9
MANTATKKFIEAVGRRKTSTARARLTEAGEASYLVNDRPIEEHFQIETLRKQVTDVIGTRNLPATFAVTVKVVGGGIASQAGAVRHAIARALLTYDEALRTDLKHTGLLKRDPRMKERRKFGLAKARKAKQWSKR